MKGKSKKIVGAIGISAVLTVLSVFLLSKLFAVIIISPDDIAIQNILSGCATGIPDGHAYFLQYPLGAALALLYRLDGGISWYQLFLVGSVALSFFLIFARVYHIAPGRKLQYLATATLLIFLLFSETVIHLEWTVIAGVLGSTAIFRFITIPKQLSPGARMFEYVICVVLLLLCFCLRNTVAYMYVPLAGILWLRELYERLKEPASAEKKRSIVLLIVFLLLCAIVVGAVMVTHKLAYSSEDWEAYKDYTKDRSTLFDYYGYPDFELYKEEYLAAGISHEAYVLMKTDYNFAVPCGSFKSVDLEAIANLAREIHTEDLTGKLETTYATLRTVLTGKTYILLNAIILILITCNFALYKDKKVIDILCIGAIVCWAVGLLTYLAYDGRLPERVIKCIDYGLIVVLWGNCIKHWLDCSQNQKMKFSGAENAINVILAAVMLGAVCIQLYNLREVNSTKENLAIAHSEILTYCNQYPKNVYFQDFWSFSQRGEQFMRAKPCSNYVRSGGWTYHTPVYDKFLANRGYENLYQAITENQNIYYLVSGSRYKQVQNRLNAYFAEKGWPVAMEMVDTFETVHETVYVLRFAQYKCLDITDNLIDSYECQISETEDGLALVTTGRDSQLYFSVPEYNGQVIGAFVSMDVQDPAFVTMFTAEKSGMYYVEKSDDGMYYSDMDVYMLESFDKYPSEIRLDPTTAKGVELSILSLKLIVCVPIA